MYLISDNTDTLTGMRMVGIPGRVVSNRAEFEEELEWVINNKDIGILLVMERLAREFPDMINDIKLSRPLPLVVEIPDRHGSGRAPDFISAYIREAIGVKL